MLQRYQLKPNLDCRYLKDDLQSVLSTLESLLTFFVFSGGMISFHHSFTSRYTFGSPGRGVGEGELPYEKARNARPWENLNLTPKGDYAYGRCLSISRLPKRYHLRLPYTFGGVSHASDITCPV